MTGAILVLLAAGLQDPSEPNSVSASVERVVQRAFENGPLQRELAAGYGASPMAPLEHRRAAAAGPMQTAAPPRPPTPGWMKLFLGMLACCAIGMAVYLSELHNL